MCVEIDHAPDSKSNVSPAYRTIRGPRPRALPDPWKKIAPSVDSPDRSLMGASTMADAAAPAFSRAEETSASALCRRDSYPLVDFMCVFPYNPASYVDTSLMTSCRLECLMNDRTTSCAGDACTIAPSVFWKLKSSG